MNSGSRRWIKLWVDPWLSSTMRFTLDHKQRAVWADLLALGGQSRVSGVICSGEESGQIVGMPLLRIAGFVDVPPEELTGMLELFEKQERIMVEQENGRVIIRLLNWSKYQAAYTRQNKYKTKKKQEKKQATPMATPMATPQATGGDYAKATPLEVEVEEVQHHCANPSGSHDGVPSQTTPKPSDEEHLAAIQRVWEHYLEKLAKNAKLLTFTPLRKSKGLARLGECLAKTGGDLARAAGLMKVAVDALAASPWHRGENPQKKAYDSWEKNLFKSQDQLEEWLAGS
jgi:hypothetical protein